MHAPTPIRGGHKVSADRSPVAPKKSAAMQNRVVFMALNMFWQLAVAVLLPLIAAVQIGKHAHAETAGVIIGLLLAIVASTAVMWRTMRIAANLPVPKLTDAQKRAIKKQYDEEDEE
jgi:drug/metabolite transporter (DMT)-like permease